MNTFHVELPYIPNERGCRIIWTKNDGDEDIVYLRHEELEELNEVLSKDSTAKIELEDGASSILVNSDVTEFLLANVDPLAIDTKTLKQTIMDFVAKNPQA